MLDFVTASLSAEGPPSQTLFNHVTQTGMTPAVDVGVYTLGVVLKFAVNGSVSKIHIYHAGDTSPTTRSAGIWLQGGTLLGSGTLLNEAVGTGWRDIVLSSPVAVTAGTVVVAGVTVTTINSYSAEVNRFASAQVISGDIIALQSNDTDGSPGNGRFNVGVGLVYPVSTFNNTNYWIDVTFTPDA